MAKKKAITDRKASAKVSSFRTKRAAKETLGQSKKVNFHLSRTTTIIIVVGLFLAGLIYFKRSWFLVATVNGQPVWRWQYGQLLEEQYGSSVLDQMVSERLVRQEAEKEGVLISEERIDQEISQIEKNLGTETSLEDLLAMQNIKMSTLRNEIEYQLMLEELLSSGIEVSKEEADQYLAENGETIAATDESGRLEEATEAVRLKKMNEKYQTWFQGLRDNAKIVSFVASKV